MSNNNLSLNDMWYAESLRLTAFPNELLPSFLEYDWWEETVGEPPENQIYKRKIGEKIENGMLEIGKLELNIKPIRFDWILSNINDKESEVELHIDFDKILSSFSPLMNKWFNIETLPPINRLAFGAILLHPVESRIDGYQFLSKYLPSVKLDPEGSSDFFYQINRRRFSTTNVPELYINRLSKWSVANLRQMGFVISDKSVKRYDGKNNYECRLEIDINTMQEFKYGLPNDEIIVIYNELIELGKEISEKGDIS